MIKTKFVFAVSLVAMLAVGSAWANTPGKDESVGAAHTVYTDQSPTSTEVEGGTTAIAGVTYVNRAVNKAGAAATAAEQHAAAAGKSALAAAESAAAAAESANDANTALADKQDKSTAVKVKTSGTAVGSETVPVYVNSNGVATAITRYGGTAAKATADASGNTITTTYEKLSNKYTTTTTGIEINNDNKDTYYPSIGKVQSMIDDTEQYVDDQIAAYDQGIGNILDSLTNTAVTHTTSTAAGTESRAVYVTSAGVATAVTGVSIPVGAAKTTSTAETAWASIWVE